MAPLHGLAQLNSTAKLLRTGPEGPRIALVIDALGGFFGAEQTLADILELYPAASIYTLICNHSAFAGTPLANRMIHTSWIQSMPGGRARYRSLLPLLPMTMESFDLRGHDVVISVSYAVAHGVLCRPDQLHIAYTCTPMRHAWQSAHEFRGRGLFGLLSRVILHYFRLWDSSAAARVDKFAALSQWTAAGIRRAYRREAEVIYPAVNTAAFTPQESRGADYVTVARLVGPKRIDVIVEAFSRLGLPLVVIGDGPERRRLQARASGKTRFLGHQDSPTIATVLGGARALVHAAEEDFGLVMAEAQSAGCPVIAFRGGAAPEVIREGETGILFDSQTPESLAQAVEGFEHVAGSIRTEDCVRYSRRFSKERFHKEFAEMVDRHWSSFRHG